MWKIYLTAKTSNSRASDLVGVVDRWAAYQFDCAVSMVGNVLENASSEMKKIGQGQNTRYEPKYKMSQLLDPDFRLPNPDKGKKEQPDPDKLLKIMGNSPGFRVD